MKRPLRHIFDYLVLIFFMSLSVVLMLIFNGNRPFQYITVIGMSLIYVVWGIIHHQKEDSLHSKITMEYVLFGLLGTVLAIGLL